jgi:hypothetical protein
MTRAVQSIRTEGGSQRKDQHALATPRTLRRPCDCSEGRRTGVPKPEITVRPSGRLITGERGTHQRATADHQWTTAKHPNLVRALTAPTVPR